MTFSFSSEKKSKEKKTLFFPPVPRGSFACDKDEGSISHTFKISEPEEEATETTSNSHLCASSLGKGIRDSDRQRRKSL